MHTKHIMHTKPLLNCKANATEVVREDSQYNVMHFGVTNPIAPSGTKDVFVAFYIPEPTQYLQ